VHGYWGQFLKVAVAHMLAVASPGPDFAMVVRQSLAHGRRAGVWTAIGVGTAILVHVTYAVLGIGILLRTYPLAFTAVKLIGAAYLAWIGLKALGTKPKAAVTGPTAWGEADPAKPTAPAARSAWTTGFLTNAFNPKATLFFVAIFASLLDPGTPRLIQAAFGLWMSATTMAWFAVVAFVFTRDEVRARFLRAGPWIDRTMGVVFIGLALALALATAR
jgi:threonine/homoserine/homoserine lactone efflux protein